MKNCEKLKTVQILGLLTPKLDKYTCLSVLYWNLTQITYIRISDKKIIIKKLAHNTVKSKTTKLMAIK